MSQSAAERLLEVALELEELRAKNRELMAQRADLIKQLIKEQGWKRTAEMLGVGRSRLFAMRAVGPPEHSP